MQELGCCSLWQNMQQYVSVLCISYSPMVDRMEVDDSRCNSGQRSCHSTVRENLYQNGWHDPLATPHTIVNPGRTITMSLKRLLREHEELYEL